MKCPECGSEDIYEQGTIIYRISLAKQKESKPIEYGELTEWLYDTSEADCYWCGNCSKEFPLST